MQPCHYNPQNQTQTPVALAPGARRPRSHSPSTGHRIRMVRVVAAWSMAWLASPSSAGQLSASAPPPLPPGNTDYLAWVNARPLADGERAAALKYATAFINLQPVPEREALEQASSGPWSDLSSVAEWLESNERPLDTYRRATEAAASRLNIHAGKDLAIGPEWTKALLFARMPILGAFELSAQASLAQGWRRWAQGDRQVLFDHAVSNLSAARHLAGALPLVARLAGMNIAERNYQIIVGALALAEDGDRVATTLVGRLTESDPPQQALDGPFDYQRLVCWDTLQRVYRPDGTIAPATSAVFKYIQNMVGRDGGEWGEIEKSLAALGFQPSVDEVNLYFDALADWNDQPARAALEQLPKVIGRGEELKNPITRLLVTGLAQPRRALIRVETLRRGTHLVAHLLSHRAEHGTLPEALDQLGDSPAIQSVRLDPYGGGDFLYFRTRNDFILYSVGADGKDDAGRPYLPRTEAGDILIWPVR